MADGEEEIEKEACVGSLCFLQPHPQYLPPPFYSKLIGRNYRWKVGAKLSTGPGLQMKVQRVVTFPNCMGLDENARWRWQHIPLSVQSGVKLDAWLHQQKGSEESSEIIPRAQTLRLFPYARIKIKNPVCGKLALRPVLELLPTPAFIVKRQFTIGKTNVSLCANFEVKASLITTISINNTLQVFHTCVYTIRANSEPHKPMYKLQLFLASCMSLHSNIFFSNSAIGVVVSERISRCWLVVQMMSAKGATWSLQFNWRKDAARLVVEPIKDVVGLHYSKTFKLSKDSKAVATGSAELPAELIWGGFSGRKGIWPFRFKIDSLKVSQIFGTRAVRTTPKSAFTYRQAANTIGEKDVISVVPGHWIDCDTEPGAAGEREFNMEVANVLEKELRMNGWEVLRPDRDAPHLSWEEYLNWVSRQTMKGIPVLEIHGQGSNADYRGHVLGVIGDQNVSLSKELAGTFGHFQMDWRELGVPRRGGLIVESFNSDEVLQMRPWHRTWAVRRLSNKIVSAVERASAPNRVPRGFVVDLDAYADLPLEKPSQGAIKH